MAWIQVDTGLVSVADTFSFRLVITNGTCEFTTTELTVNFVPDPVFSFTPGDSVAATGPVAGDPAGR